MSEYTHSMILFSGDDGLPIQFNIQSVAEKELFKNMIEFGGGICTHSADAVFLVSPGTKVFNYPVGKKVISSRFITDCVEENFLLNMEDYKIQITEVEASDFSEDSSLKMLEKAGGKLSDSNDNSVDIIDQNKNVSPNELIFPKSNHAFDFGDTEQITICASKRTSPVYPLQFFPRPPSNEPQLKTSTTSEESNISFGETALSNVTENRSKLHISPTPPDPHNKGCFPNDSQNKRKFLTSTEREDIAFLNEEFTLNTDEGKNKMQISSTPEDLISYNEGCLPAIHRKETKLRTTTTSDVQNISPGVESSNSHKNKSQVSMDKHCMSLGENKTSTINNKRNETYPVTNEKIDTLHSVQNQPFDPGNDLPDSSEDLERSIADGQNLVVAEDLEIQHDFPAALENHTVDPNSSAEESSINVVVTSSQPNVSGLDQFDMMILNKLQEKPNEQEKELSQSYTVSSSADAQVASKPSPRDTSAEIFAGSAAVPDSPGQITERQKYIKDIEIEVQKILEKPSPKSIQDKIMLVKYICCVKKLAPATVLQTLQNF